MQDCIHTNTAFATTGYIWISCDEIQALKQERSSPSGYCLSRSFLKMIGSKHNIIFELHICLF